MTYNPKAKGARRRSGFRVTMLTLPLLAAIIVISGLAVTTGFHASLPHSLSSITTMERALPGQQDSSVALAAGLDGCNGVKCTARGGGGDGALAGEQHWQQAAGEAGNGTGTAATAVSGVEAAATRQQQQAVAVGGTGGGAAAAKQVAVKAAVEKDIEDLIEEAAMGERQGERGHMDLEDWYSSFKSSPADTDPWCCCASLQASGLTSPHRNRLANTPAVAHDQGVKTNADSATDAQLAANGVKRRYVYEVRRC